jgi:glucosamine 6-phosphate synthetase-like amidotransferase/phosphosugar isomerase protein
MNELMLREIEDQPTILRESLVDLRYQLATLDLPAFDRVVLTGCGDSLYASMAVESLFAETLRRPIVALSSMSASRFHRHGPGELAVAVSVSGEAVRTIEAALAAKRRGAHLVSIVADEGSTLAGVSDWSLVMPSPMTRSTPHTRDYTLTLLALGAACERLGHAEFDMLDRWPAVIESVMPNALAWASTLLPVPAERRVWFLGAGPDLGTAAYGAMKFWEAGGSQAWWDDLEEFGHGSQLVAIPGDDVVLLAPGRAGSRALEVLPALVRMGLRPILVNGQAHQGRLEDSTPRFGLPNVPATPWAPFLSCLPVQALTYAVATHRGIDVEQPLGGKPHGSLYEDVHVSWVRQGRLEPEE